MIINGAITVIYKGRSQNRIIRTQGRSEKTKSLLVGNGRM